MPTQAARPQQDGTLQEFQVLVGADFPFEAIDDSFDGTNDGDTTTVNIGRGHRISFPFLNQFSTPDIVPTSVLIRVVARKEGVPPVSIQIGMYQGGDIQVGADIVLTNSHVEYTRTFATNPFTGAAWAKGDLVAVQILAQLAVFPHGTSRITLLNGEITYELPTNWSGNPYRVGRRGRFTT